MVKQTKKKTKKVVLPPELPPEVLEDDIEVSDEDLQFVDENRDYVRLVSRLDTESLTRHVTRAADLEGEELEAAYEKRLRKKSQQKQEEEKKQLEVDRVDALPIKTLDGKLHFRTVSKKSENGEVGDDEKDDEVVDNGLVKLTKAERRDKLKKSKREAKKQGKQLEEETEEVQQTSQAAVLAEVQEDLTAEEAFAKKKSKLAELGIALLADPESNIKSLKELLEFCRDIDPAVVKLGLLSLLAVFKDIIPGYRIRLPTEKELEMKVSKEVKKMRYYESTLLSVYKGYLQKLILLDKKSQFHHVAVRCICCLLEAVPHFNFRENLLAAVVENIGSSDDVIRKLCCASIKSLFINEGKHGGQATVEAVRLIADHVKAHNCQLHPDSIEVFLSLSFDEDLAKRQREEKENRVKAKKYKKRKTVEEPKQLNINDRKKSKKELMSKMREEVASDIKAAGFTPDLSEQRTMQTETLNAVFETYFRILKHTMQSITASSEANGNIVSSVSAAYPLFAPCLNGLGKFSHLIDMDYMGDLMNYLKRLGGGRSNPDSSSEKCLKSLTVTERLQCCIVAFKVMKINLDALNVDLQGFFVLLYNLILEYRPGRDNGEVLAEALKIMLCQDRQHDMQKAAAFAKRLATFSLCFGSAECMAALVTVKFLLQKNVKCRNLLENDAGGGSVSGSIAKYQPYVEDPNLSGALNSVLWELSLLSKHYHPTVSAMASSISSLSSSQSQVYIPSATPQQAFTGLSLERELLNLKFDIKKSSNKRKRGSSKATNTEKTPDTDPTDEEELKKKLSDHFKLRSDLKENERLRGELDRTTLALQLYDEYKEQKRKSRRLNIQKKR
ncbi:nucleolar complex-associated protein 3 [Euphorbia lathyris]|uniref:nucleolar complex-associated protein 3 n=1 Tax=Euphorbia lathyris TaxID=212925 RepID=UPI0033136366